MFYLTSIQKKYKSSIHIFFTIVFSQFIVVSGFANGIGIHKNIPKGELYEKLNQKIDVNLTFINHDNKKIFIKDLLKDNSVLLITLNYYKCTTSCSFQFVNLSSALKKINWPIGKEFRIATFSFDPNDNVALAKEKQKFWTSKTGQNDAKWDFFVGNNKETIALIQSLNFYYELDALSGEYAHSAALFFIKPDGTFYRYLYGYTYDAQSIKHALIETSEGKLGSFFDKLFTMFKKYRPNIGKYTYF